jgi:hypothetical protein
MYRWLCDRWSFLLLAKVWPPQPPHVSSTSQRRTKTQKFFGSFFQKRTLFLSLSAE